MKKTFMDMFGKSFEVDFQEHCIDKYEVLFHMTLKENEESILKNGLLRGQPLYKSFVETNMLFFSYPIDMTTGDLFRFSEDFHCIVVLDGAKLREKGIVFYDDYFGSVDASSKRNHLCCDVDIPADCIKKILKFDSETEQ